MCIFTDIRISRIYAFNICVYIAKVSLERRSYGDCAGVGTAPSEGSQVATFIDECECKIEALDDATLRQIALLRLEGHETRQIAEKLDVHQRTVQRKLSYIQSLWIAEEADE